MNDMKISKPLALAAACALAAYAMPAVVSAGEAPFAFRARYDRVHELVRSLMAYL